MIMKNAGSILGSKLIGNLKCKKSVDVTSIYEKRKRTCSRGKEYLLRKMKTSCKMLRKGKPFLAGNVVPAKES